MIKLNQLNQEWFEEFTKYRHYIKSESLMFYYDIVKINKAISQISYIDFCIELTTKETVKYTLILPDDKILIISKYFEYYPEQDNDVVVFSIFEDKKLILSNVKVLLELVNGINNYLKN